jgi:lambda family phage portal protein
MQPAIQNNPLQSDIFSKAVGAIASFLNQSPMRSRNGHPVILGPDARPLPPSAVYQFQRQSAQRKGSLKTWIPRRLMSEQLESMEREAIVERSSDLINNDPHAAGIVDTFATTIVGSGLNPHPSIDSAIVGMDREAVRAIQVQLKNIFRIWSGFADAGQKSSFYGLQFLAQRMLLQFGEYLFLLPMIKDSSRPYRLAIQAIHPLRLKTPVDLINRKNIRDGVQVGKFGEPIAYYIKKSESANLAADTSNNFLRIRAKQGHRFKVMHGFICNEPEQVRGIPFFSPAMKFFKDLSDYLDAELVSNIVTAAFALFVETGAVDPLFPAQSFSTITETGYKSDGTEYDQRYQEIVPGSVMYGAEGQKPHALSAQRPGATFEPFIRTIERSISLSLDIPYPVLFKDFEGMNYASYRSAMLEAWRVFNHRRKWLGSGFCQIPYSMLIEEAWLKGELPMIEDFYGQMYNLLNAQWIGPPKGQIEPVKEAQADIVSIQNNLKTREEVILERGRDLRSTFDQLEEEQELMDDKGLTEVKIEPEADQNNNSEEDNDDATD